MKSKQRSNFNEINDSSEGKKYKTINFLEYLLQIELIDEYNVHILLTFFDNKKNQIEIYEKNITYECIDQEAQFIFPNIQLFYHKCFSQICAIYVEKGCIRILYDIEMKKSSKLWEIEKDKQQRSFTILLNFQQASKQTMIKKWIQNIKSKYLQTVQRKIKNLTKLQYLKSIINEHSHQYRNKWHKFIKSKNILKKESKRFDKNVKVCECFQIPFNICNIKINNKQIFHYMINQAEKWTVPQTINLELSSIGNQEILSFNKIQKIGNLKHLNLSENNISAEGARYLWQLKLTNLQILNLKHNQLRDEGLQYISEAKFLNLVSLKLQNNYLTAEGVKYLSKAQFPNLTTLYLSNNSLLNKGLQQLSKCKLINLINLYLLNISITVKGVQIYLQLTNFPNLAHLNLSFNQIRGRGMNILQKLLPNIFIKI